MAETSIAWTDRTLNPIRARNRATGKEGHFCEKISPGCAHCYAAELNVQQRFLGTGLDFIPQNRDKVEVFLDLKRMEELQKRRKPTRYFLCDMTDLFGEWVPDGWLCQLYKLMGAASHHTFQLLTKRASRMQHFLREQTNAHAIRMLDEPGFCVTWPYPNVWHGVSVENRATLHRIDSLRETPAAIRFLSLEPLLEDLGPLDLAGIHWVIVGGESGKSRRPSEVAWYTSIRDQCAAAGVQFFCKQDTAFAPGQRGRLPLDLFTTRQFPATCGV